MWFQSILDKTKTGWFATTSLSFGMLPRVNSKLRRKANKHAPRP